MYWVDTYLDYIERCDYDGNNRKTVVRGAPVENLYGLAVFQNKLFVGFSIFTSLHLEGCIGRNHPCFRR